MDLTDDERHILRLALTDAIYYRFNPEDAGNGHCGDCMNADDLCEDHMRDKERAEQYRVLLEQLR